MAKPPTLAEKWDKVTERLVDLSTVAFVFLLMPQLWKNYQALAAGNASALAGLSWMGFLTALMGNTQLLGYFINKGERSAVTIQAIGVATNYAVLAQIWLAGILPHALGYTLVGAAMLTAGINLGLCKGWVTREARLWRAWQALTALAGLVVLPQVLWSTFVSSGTIAPALVAGVLGLGLIGLDAMGRLPEGLDGLWNGLSAWTATLLFCCQPIAQLAANLLHPEMVSGLSLATVLLAMTGNGMMVPRALRTRDVIWMTGTIWGSVAMGWGNLLCMAMATASAGANLLSWPHFTAITVALFSYLTGALIMDVHVRRNSPPVQTV